MSPATPSIDGTSSGSMSRDILNPQNDDHSVLPLGTKSQSITEELADVRLSEDIPLPSTEGGSSESDGGVDISVDGIQSRAPYVQLSPSPDSTDAGNHSYHAVPRGGSVTIDDRLDMSQLADAIQEVAVGSESPSILLRPEQPSAGKNDPHRRRRSSSRINTPPHDLADEELPYDRFHDPTFQARISDTQRIVSELTDVLSRNSLIDAPDSTIRRLYIESRRLAQFQCQATRKVGFVGDSGVGKSSLLNSLLDAKDLARTSNSGEACTCVATEYHFHDSNTFAIDVDWLTVDETTAQLSELLQSYRRFHLHGPDLDPQERKDSEDRANVAKDTFNAMFRGRLEDEQFLTLSSQSAVLETLKSWVAESRISATGTREEPRSIDQEAAKWPFIKKIKVFLKAHILSKGLVLVDLPGLRDLNSARRNITERYMLQCDEIFAVCNIGRVTTDASIVSVFDLARQASLSNVGIICTRSDDIRVEEAIRDWRGKRATKIKHFMDTIATDRRTVDSIKVDLEDYSTDDDLSKEEATEMVTLNRRLDQAKKRLDLHQSELNMYLITTRNTDVQQTLDSLWRNEIPGNLFQSFSVSNTEYWNHRNLPKETAFPHLCVSGILALRKHCISMVAEFQLSAATKYIHNDVPALLADIELWVQTGKGGIDADQRAKIRETFNTLESRVNQELLGSSSDVNTIARSSNQAFRALILEAQRVADWTRAAKNASQGWAGWHHATYSAFCRNFGDYDSPTVDAHNWNEEAINEMVGDLDTPWETLKSTLYRDLEGRENRIQQLMEWVIEYLDNELPNSSEPRITLQRAMSSRQHLLLGDVEQSFDKFKIDLSALRTLAFSGFRTSHFGEIMNPSYLACINEGGLGSDARRKAIINRKLSSEATFESLLAKLKTSFKANVDSLQHDIQTAVTQHLGVIKNTLDIVRNNNIALESEREPEFRASVERKTEAVRQEMRRIREAINV